MSFSISLLTGDVADLNKSGRPIKLNESEERMLIETVKSQSDMTILEIIDGSNLDNYKATGEISSNHTVLNLRQCQ